MNMGLVTSTGRHTALDPDVVFHEYAHGLTNRLVGGPLNDSALDAVQSGGMGEGWSDFFACVALNKTVVGDWVVNRSTGIRKFRYDDNFPDNYGSLGTGRYVGDAVHNLGEVWCATLMTLTRRIGRWETAQVAVDALKLTPANPSFLAARDAILLAADRYAAGRGDSDTERAEFVQTVWEVFAEYGMGPGARTGGAENLSGIVADFTAPERPSPEPEPEPGEVVEGSAHPGITIPDNDRTGVSSAIELFDAREIRSLQVTVDITHTYRGDLQVDLVAPDGRRTSLHNRSGAGANDVRQTWHSDQHAGLAQLIGMAAEGTWTLVVSDRALRDEGTLNSWSLQARVTEPRAVVEAESSPGLLIPDKSRAGVRSEITVDGQGTISSLVLDIDITHTYVGDLEVTLTGPDGTSVKVHGRTGGSSDNLITSYESGSGGRLAPFVGKAVGGVWQLHVADLAGLDIGKLNRWKLVARA
jgi:extracellular elastinolytic metalloproteinase